MKYPIIKSPRKEFDFSLFYANSDRDYPIALREIKAGRKSGHWIWYILPQLSSLGTSQRAIYFGLKSMFEVVSYLKDCKLGPRLVEICTALCDHIENGANITHLMGSSVDSAKLLQCATLFYYAARCTRSRRQLELFRKLRTFCEQSVRDTDNRHTVTFCEVSLLCISPTTWPEHTDKHFHESGLSQTDRVTLREFSMESHRSHGEDYTDQQYREDYSDSKFNDGATERDYRDDIRESMHQYVLLLLPSVVSSQQEWDGDDVYL